MPPAFVLPGCFYSSGQITLQPINSHFVLRQYRLLTLHLPEAVTKRPEGTHSGSMHLP